MRKTLFALAVCAAVATNAVAQATISGSAHDLRGYVGTGGTLPATGELCVYCHTPHNALVNVPLWNHAASTQTFQMYGGSTTIQGTIAGTPTGVSLQCLSCHDGVTNLDAYGGATGSVQMLSTAPAVMGTNLTNDHPISITYRNDLDLELNAPTGAAVDILPLFGAATPYTVECGSCHDPHGAGATLVKFLRKDNAGSALCTTCHNK